MKNKKSNMIKLISLDLLRFLIIFAMIFILGVRALSNQADSKYTTQQTATNDNIYVATSK